MGLDLKGKPNKSYFSVLQSIAGRLSRIHMDFIVSRRLVIVKLVANPCAL